VTKRETIKTQGEELPGGRIADAQECHTNLNIPQANWSHDEEKIRYRVK